MGKLCIRKVRTHNIKILQKLLSFSACCKGEINVKILSYEGRDLECITIHYQSSKLQGKRNNRTKMITYMAWQALLLPFA